jgi:hypothetical protein
LKNTNGTYGGEFLLSWDGTGLGTVYLAAQDSTAIPLPAITAGQHTLVVLGLESDDGNFLGYRLTLPTPLEFISVVSDQSGSTPTPLSGQTASDLLLLNPVSPPLRKERDTYTIGSL